jgi:hypothetical protein
MTEFSFLVSGLGAKMGRGAGRGTDEVSPGIRRKGPRSLDHLIACSHVM